MKKTLKRVDPLQLGKILGALYGSVSLIFIPVILFVTAFGSLAAKHADQSNLPVGIGLGVAAMIFIPLMYALMGFLTGFIGAWAYNLIAKRIGGIRIEVE